MFRIVLSLFLTGLVLGSGPCILSCGPLIASYITATKKSGYSGLKAYFVFSVVRILVYMALGILAGFFGEHILVDLFEGRFLSYLYLIFGFFLILLGATLISGKFFTEKGCIFSADGSTGAGDIRNLVIFALIVSFSPCLPLISILGFVVLISDTPLKGAIFSGAFGLGTVLSPMILLVLISGWFGQILRDKARMLKVVRLICGIVICYLGVLLIIRAYALFIQ